MRAGAPALRADFVVLRFYLGDRGLEIFQRQIVLIGVELFRLAAKMRTLELARPASAPTHSLQQVRFFLIVQLNQISYIHGRLRNGSGDT